MLDSKAVLPEGFSFETLSIPQLEMFSSPGYALLETDAARAAALQEADKSVAPALGQGTEGTGTPAGNAAALQNPSSRSFRDRFTGIFWQPYEIKALTAHDVRNVRAEKIDAALKAGSLVATVVEGLAGVTVIPAPVVRAAEALVETVVEKLIPEVKRDLPEGFDYAKLTASQLAIVADDKFWGMAAEAQRKLLVQAGPPEASSAEEVVKTFVAPKEEVVPEVLAPAPVVVAPATHDDSEF